MDIRTGFDGLRSLLGVSETSPAAPQATKNGPAQESSPLSSDSATLSNAGSQVAETATDGGVRMDKVASIQSALAEDTYNVSASAVASRVVDSMLAAGTR